MDSTTLVAVAQNALGNKAWSVEMVLRIGSVLLSFVNDIPNLSFQNKSDLVCQTILKMLDDAEKAERVLKGESTEKEKTIYYLEECKKSVLIALPVSLELLAGSALVSQKIQRPTRCFPCLPCLPCLPSLSKEVHETVTAMEDALKHPQEYLEEMRDLVSKVEKLVSSSLPAKPVVSAVSQEIPPLPPSPELFDEQLPGVSVIPE